MENKRKRLYWVNVVLLISFFLTALTGIFKFPGLSRFFSYIFEIIPANYMRLIHDWSGLVMVLFSVIHLILNWGWMKVNTKMLFTKEDGK